MSAKYFRSTLVELKNMYNVHQVQIVSALRSKYDPHWLSYQQDKKDQLILDESAKTRDTDKKEFVNLRNNILSEKSDAKNKIQSLKFPNISSKDANQKLIGEQWKTQAQIYLLSQHSPDQLINEIRNAFDSSRIDYGNSILESVKSSLPDPKIEVLSADQERLSSALETIQQLQQELKDIAPAEEIASDLIEQIESEKNKIGYYTREEVNAMTREQISADLDTVNYSVSRWKDE
jgi:hypothetical protein